MIYQNFKYISWLQIVKMNKINLLLMKKCIFFKIFETWTNSNNFIISNIELLGTTLFSKVMPNFCRPQAMSVIKLKKDILLVNHFCYKIEAILYPRVSYSITKLKLLNTNSAQRDNDYSVALLKKKSFLNKQWALFHWGNLFSGYYAVDFKKILINFVISSTLNITRSTSHICS